MKKLVLTLVVVLSLGLAASAEAVVLTPGDTSVSTGAVSPGTGDPILASIFDAPFVTTTGRVSGTYDAWVSQDADGFLVFQYQVHNAETSDDAVHRVTVIDFFGYATDVDSGFAGNEIDRSAGGGSVGWDFAGNGIMPNTTSSILWVKTDATNYTRGWINLINGGVGTYPAFQPASAVPEPTSMLLFGTGLLGFAGRLRKKFNV